MLCNRLTKRWACEAQDKKRQLSRGMTLFDLISRNISSFPPLELSLLSLAWFAAASPRRRGAQSVALSLRVLPVWQWCQTDVTWRRGPLLAIQLWGSGFVFCACEFQSWSGTVPCGTGFLEDFSTFWVEAVQFLSTEKNNQHHCRCSTIPCFKFWRIGSMSHCDWVSLSFSFFFCSVLEIPFLFCGFCQLFS